VQDKEWCADAVCCPREWEQIQIESDFGCEPYHNSSIGDSMKKDARQRAESIFLDADGKISNVEIAKKVGVNALTVGRWKKADGWTTNLMAKSEKREEKTVSRPARKKGAQEQALKLFIEAGGDITNTALARKVGVSTNSIANWKRGGRWAETLMEATKPSSPQPVLIEETVTAPQAQVAETAQDIEIDLEKLTCPDHIDRLNKRIDDMLSQEYLSPGDLKVLAEAKQAVLGVVSAYLDVVDRCEED
jgi:hypothetical protein